jgi:hypothetical protein
VEPVIRLDARDDRVGGCRRIMRARLDGTRTELADRIDVGQVPALWSMRLVMEDGSQDPGAEHLLVRVRHFQSTRAEVFGGCHAVPVRAVFLEVGGRKRSPYCSPDGAGRTR